MGMPGKIIRIVYVIARIQGALACVSSSHHGESACPLCLFTWECGKVLCGAAIPYQRCQRSSLFLSISLTYTYTHTHTTHILCVPLQVFNGDTVPHVVQFYATPMSDFKVEGAGTHKAVVLIDEIVSRLCVRISENCKGLLEYWKKAEAGSQGKTPPHTVSP